jgi:hypothetical protein
VYDINRIPIDGSAPTQRVVRTPWDKMASSVSPDGQTVVYTENRAGMAIHAASLSGSGRPGPLLASDANQLRAVFSPTARWIAYEEAVGDRSNVFIASADGSGGRRQVSVDGGTQARWTRGGREIVYRRGDAMFAVAVDPAAGEVGAPVELFRRRQFTLDVATFGYDVTSDGSRFVMAVPIARPEAQPFVVVLNWLDELKAKVAR